MRGSTRALTDSSGAIVEAYDYAAFGDLLQPIPDPVSSYLYTGQRYDATTEQYTLRAREYDPAVGRFLSRDTWAVDTWNPDKAKLKETILALRAAGWSYRQIGREVGLHWT